MAPAVAATLIEIDIERRDATRRMFDESAGVGPGGTSRSVLASMTVPVLMAH
jgi:hypothetical protein